jgi:hypothetical protein
MPYLLASVSKAKAYHVVFRESLSGNRQKYLFCPPPATYRQPDDNHDVGFFSDERTTYYTLAASGSDSSTILADETDPR